MKKVFKTLLMAALTAAMIAPAAMGAYKRNDNASISRNMNIFNSLFKELNAFYVDTIDAQKSIETAIKAMLNEVDPYTEYISAKDQEDFMVVSTGEYGGIGSYISERNGCVYFSEPQIGTPAARAGIRAGDKIVQIDTTSTVGMKSDQVSARLKGTP